MILSKEAILEEIEKGNIVFDGKLAQVQNQSIDVSLGSEILIDFHDEYIPSSIYPYKSLNKGVFFLAHTQEFVGTRVGSNIHCQFQQTSTSARLGLFHPKAGWGDIGYINRWALEFYVCRDIMIKAGDIIGQMTFSYTTPTQTDYALNGQYQHTNDLQELKKNWKIESILPKKVLKNVNNYE